MDYEVMKNSQDENTGALKYKFNIYDDKRINMRLETRAPFQYTYVVLSVQEIPLRR